MKVDKLMMKRLLIVKQFFNHGSIHRKEKTSLGNMLACHHFDLSIEIFLKILGGKLNANLDREMNFWNLWKKVNMVYKEKYDEDLFLKQEILGLRDARNSVQHNANIPSEQDLERFEAYTRTFLDHTLNKVFKKSFGDIKLLDIIRDEKLKKYLNEAKRTIDNGNFVKAVRNVSIAFCYGKELAVAKAFGERGIKDSIYQEALGTNAHDVLIRIIGSIQERLELLMLNIDYRRYAKFKEISFPTHSYWDNGELYVKTFVSYPLSYHLSGELKDFKSKEDAEFCYEFVLDFCTELGV